MTFVIWYGKTRMVWLPHGEKYLKICVFVFTESTNVMDRHTLHDGISRACIASHDKNLLVFACTDKLQFALLSLCEIRPLHLYNADQKNSNKQDTNQP